MLCKSYINDYLKEIIKSWEIFSYSNDLFILYEGLNQLLNVLNKIEK